MRRAAGSCSHSSAGGASRTSARSLPGRAEQRNADGQAVGVANGKLTCGNPAMPAMQVIAIVRRRTASTAAGSASRRGATLAADGSTATAVVAEHRRACGPGLRAPGTRAAARRLRSRGLLRRQRAAMAGREDRSVRA